MTATITAIGLQFLWSFIVSSIVWSLLFLTFGRMFFNPIVSILLLTLVTFGLSIVFDITEGIVFIFTSALIAVLNSSFGLFGLTAIFAIAGIASMLVSAIAVFISRAVEV